MPVISALMRVMRWMSAYLSYTAGLSLKQINKEWSIKHDLINKKDNKISKNEYYESAFSCYISIQIIDSINNSYQ